jgi:hypothetical protein
MAKHAEPALLEDILFKMSVLLKNKCGLGGIQSVRPFFYVFISLSSCRKNAIMFHKNYNDLAHL